MITKDYPIAVPADRVNAQGDAYVCATEDCTGTPCRIIGVYRFCSDCAQDLRLPSCEPYRQGETVVDHGARVLLYILDTGCTATLSELELQRAQHASQYAICARGISVPAADRLSDVRHQIAQSLATLQTIETELRTPGGQLKGGWRPIGGDREPLEPAPKDHPPAGAYGVELEEARTPFYPAERRDRIAF